jgi:Icc-related predicted phosphoesterase
LKILHLSDLHDNGLFYTWIDQEVRQTKYDALVISGDLLNMNNLWRIRSQTKWVKAWADKLPKDLMVFLVSGNHDKIWEHPILDEAKWLGSIKRENLYIDGESVETGGFCFECVGWGQVPIAETKLPKIIISHSPPSPAATGLNERGMDVGCELLSEHILQSSSETWLVLCGHAHRPQRWCNLGRFVSLNPGSNPDATIPNHIIIDTKKRRALHVTEEISATSSSCTLPPFR